MPAFALRPGTAADFDFAYDLYRELMQPLTVALIGRWSDDGERPVVRAGLAAGNVQIVEVVGRPAGWIQIREIEGRLDLQQIYVVASLQGSGLGTALIRALQERGLPIALSVMHNNHRARALYLRLGFRDAAERAHKHEMRWIPTGISSGTRGSGPG